MQVLFVLAGNPPDAKLLKTEMSQADLVIAVDGGSRIFLQNKLQPDLIIGDLDSYIGRFDASIKIIERHDQNFTDLEKALKYLFDNYAPSSLVFLGATGGRTDHLLNNLHICASIDFDIGICFKSNIPLNDGQQNETITRVVASRDIDLSVTTGSTVSVLPVTNFTNLSVRGLFWKIDHVDSNSSIVSQSNIAVSNVLNITLVSGCAYITVYQ